jgi:hypothetical protein
MKPYSGLQLSMTLASLRLCVRLFLAKAQSSQRNAKKSHTQWQLAIEFKEAKRQYDNDKLFSYCVAIANEGGGKFILGVTDSLPRKITSTSAFNDPAVRQKRKS